MIIELEGVDEERMHAFKNLSIQKKKISRIYNKKVKKKNFEEGDLVWKVILPVGAKDREYRKWSPNWERPFKVHRVLKGNAYLLSSLDREPHKRSINGRYLKNNFPQCRKL